MSLPAYRFLHARLSTGLVGTLPELYNGQVPVFNRVPEDAPSAYVHIGDPVSSEDRASKNGSSVDHFITIDLHLVRPRTDGSADQVIALASIAHALLNRYKPAGPSLGFVLEESNATFGPRLDDDVSHIAVVEWSGLIRQI